MQGKARKVTNTKHDIWQAYQTTTEKLSKLQDLIEIIPINTSKMEIIFESEKRLPSLTFNAQQQSPS